VLLAEVNEDDFLYDDDRDPRMMEGPASTVAGTPEDQPVPGLPPPTP
jgi:hypothetical protein